MNKVELIIGNPSFADLDLDSGFDVALQYSIADIKDISKRNSAYSKTIILPGSKNNNYWLGNLFDVNSDFSGFNPNKKTPAKLLINSEIVLNGFLQLRKIKKLINVDHQGNMIQYEVVLFDNAVDLMTELGEKGINELNLRELEHIYSRANIIASWNNDWKDGYVYPMYGTRDKNSLYMVEQFHPAVFYKKVFSQILQEAGYGWTGSLATNEQFEKEIIPYMGDKTPKISDIELNRRRFRAGIIDGPTYNAGTTEIWSPVNIHDIYVPFNNTSTLPNFDNGPTFNTNTYEWVADRNGVFSFDYSVSYNLEIFNTISDNIYIALQDGIKFEHRLEVLENGVWQEWPNSTMIVIPPMLNNNYFDINTTITLNVNSSHTTGERQVYIGQRVRMRMFVIKTAGGFYDFGSGVINNLVISLPTILTFPNTPNNFLRSNPITGTITQGDIVDFSTVLSDKLKQKDLISDLIKRYNLFIQVDPDNPNLLIFDSRTDFYEGGQVLDWTKKKDYSSEDNIELLSELQFKTMLFSYKPDNDIDNAYYKQVTGDVYGQYKWTFDNDFVKGEKKIESPFSPTPLIKTAFNAIVPAINPDEPKGNPRVLYWGGLRPLTTPWLFGHYVFTPAGPIPIPIQITTGYPYAGHLDDPINPELDINFGTFKFPMYSGLNAMTNNNMFNQYWFNYVDQISDGRLVTSKFYLTEADIRFIKNNFNSKIFVLDSYYYINRIKDYKPMSNGVTEVELLKIKEGVRWKQTGLTSIGYTPVDSILDPGPINGGGGTVIGNSTGGVKGLNIGSNNIGGGVVIDSEGLTTVLPQIIAGNNNKLGGGGLVVGDNNISSNKSVVLGDNNELLVSNSMVINSNNNKLLQSAGILMSDFNEITKSGCLVINGNSNYVEEKDVTLLGSYGITASVKDSVYIGNKARIGVFDGRFEITDVKFEEATKVFNGNLETLDDYNDILSEKSRDTLTYNGAINKWEPGGRYYTNFFDFDGDNTTVLTQNTWAPLVLIAKKGFTSTDDLLIDNNGLVTWNGVEDIVFKIEAIISGSSGNNNEIHGAFFKNDSLWPCSEQTVVTSAAGRANNIPIQCFVDMKPGDTLRLYIKNSTSNNDFVLLNVNVMITEL